jgi:hypothetical protein
MGLDEVGFTSVDGFELFTVCSHFLQMLDLKRETVHMSVVCESVGIHPILVGEVHMLPRHSQSIKRRESRVSVQSHEWDFAFNAVGHTRPFYFGAILL